jgi:hypothetical protein
MRENKCSFEVGLTQILSGIRFSVKICTNLTKIMKIHEKSQKQSKNEPITEIRPKFGLAVKLQFGTTFRKFVWKIIWLRVLTFSDSWNCLPIIKVEFTVQDEKKSEASLNSKSQKIHLAKNSAQNSPKTMFRRSVISFNTCCLLLFRGDLILRKRGETAF